MKVVQSVSDMAQLAQQWSFDPQVAVVPTMGALHEGHLALVKAARTNAERVIVTIFVNPLQFAPGEDLDKYPRTLQKDLDLLEQAGADVVFTPDVNDITPQDMRITIDPGPMADVLCGNYRPDHFRGVCTIVAKLFNITRPGTACFGWKDAQQFLILRKMVQDLNMPVSLIGLDTIRESDGLAMSSRNAYLTPEQRAAAPVLNRALETARKQFEAGEQGSAALLHTVRSIISNEPLARLQYCEVVSMNTLEPVDIITRGNTLIAVAVYFGETRLIDNMRL